VTELLLGPALRYAGNTQALIWVETDGPCTVSVLNCESKTFCVEGHHYALVVCEGLEPGTITPYEVALEAFAISPQNRFQVMAATSETLAHLELLRFEGRTLKAEEDGVVRYRAAR